MSNLLDNEVIEFTTSDGRFTFTVRKEFFTKRIWREIWNGFTRDDESELKELIKEMSKWPVYQLMVTEKMSQYLHNVNGYAVFDHHSQKGEYFINGINNTKKQQNKENIKSDIMSILNGVD